MVAVRSTRLLVTFFLLRPVAMVEAFKHLLLRVGPVYSVLAVADGLILTWMPF